MTTTAASRPGAHTPSVRAAVVSDTRERLVRRLPSDRVGGWLWPALVAAIAGALRFWRLGEPHAFAFDETYYAKDAWSLLRFGAEQEYREGADARILAGDLEQWTGNAAYVVHPPAGKWLIAAGEALFGFDPTGWRVAVALLGTLSVLIIARVARRMFGSTLLGCVAAVLLASDGMHFVQSRTALLDLILMFWVLVAFGCLLLDRDATRGRLATWRGSRARASGFGPRLGWRPWRLAAGLCLGLACGTKWSGLWFVAAFGLLSYAWDIGARRTAGLPVTRASAAVVAAAAALGSLALAYRLLPDDGGSLARPAVLAVTGGVLLGVAVWTVTRAVDLRTVRAAAGHLGTAVSALVLVPVGAYLLTWAGWFAADPARAYNRGFAGSSDGLAGLVPRPVQALWSYHRQAFQFHQGLREPHPYASNPWSWPMLGRPVSFFYADPKRGESGCTAEACSKAVTALGTPLVWWAGILAVLVVTLLALGARDWRATAILAGIAGGYLPWFAFQERTVYSFYAIVFLPFVVLAITMCIGLMLGSRDASASRRTWGAAFAGAYLVLVVANFGYLYPVLAAEVIPTTEWSERMWFRSWI